MSGHPAHVYTTREEWIARFVDSPVGRRRANRTWKQHIEKNGNVPLVTKCSVCSGAEFKQDIRHGSYNVARPSKVLRDETNPTKVQNGNTGN